ncbi:uncharacterized protein CEXT_281741 [Caerostris extrusa]|uniref:Uncharacterized protein n=1 Tax=Caerostris extrusa TaxID=172846 RepID=A0AAV4XRX3_CAEEX|nr:uncharacterized protein CEXT_281741 [Caerostris extrusa]
MIPYIDISDVIKLFSRASVVFSAVQLPFVLLSAAVRRALFEIVSLVSTIANSIAILICYIYLKNFKRHSAIIVDGYISIFKTFAEFISAIVCLCYGLMEVDFFYTTLGIIGIMAGLIRKALFLYSEHHHQTNLMKTFIYGVSVLYIMCVLTCSFAFHAVAISIGILPCVTRILTCIMPLVALSESFRTSGVIGKYFAYLTDIVAVSVLWWYCAHLSLKYFIVVPSVVGLMFSVIQYALTEIQKITSKEIESDIYQQQ